MAQRGLSNAEIDELAEMMRSAPNVFRDYIPALEAMKQENGAGTSPQGEELCREFLAGVELRGSYIARALCLVAGEIRAHRYATVDAIERLVKASETAAKLGGS
jgi:hypothetical protein